MYAIPRQSIEEWFATLDQALMIAPEHISCYELTIDTGTPLEKELESGAISLPDEDLQFDFFIKTSERLENAGYVHYEVSNFAGKLNLASRHNRKYWDHVPYLGLGPSAHSFLHNRRWWNHRSLSRYLDDLHKAKKPVDETETLTDDQLCLEALSLGLRTKKGINLTDFKMKYHVDLLREKNDILARLKDEGLIDIENGTLSPTRFGLAVADTLPLI
jgi:oxygen-independent coproporphyrinogen-3 oxidase